MKIISQNQIEIFMHSLQPKIIGQKESLYDLLKTT